LLGSVATDSPAPAVVSPGSTNGLATTGAAPAGSAPLSSTASGFAVPGPSPAQESASVPGADEALGGLSLESSGSTQFPGAPGSNSPANRLELPPASPGAAGGFGSTSGGGGSNGEPIAGAPGTRAAVAGTQLSMPVVIGQTPCPGVCLASRLERPG
jgi:hypothetical protein